jgi:hypothetical protein
MTHKNSSSTVKSVTAELKVIRDYHKLGCQVLKRVGDGKRAKYSPGVIMELVEETGKTESVLNKARQFAQMYTLSDLKTLCDLCKNERFAVGIGHLVQLITIRQKRTRKKWERDTVRNQWSVAELRKQKAKELGKDSKAVKGGRPFKRPESAEDALQSLADMCDHWRRWCDMMEPVDDEAEGQIDLDDLPKPLAAATKKVLDATLQLSAKIDKASNSQ